MPLSTMWQNMTTRDMAMNKNVRRSTLLFMAVIMAMVLGCRAGSPVKTPAKDLERVSEQPKQTDGETDTFKVLDDVATIYRLSMARKYLEDGDTAKVVTVFERMTELQEQQGEKHCVDTFENCYGLAVIYQRNGQFEDAKSIYMKLNSEHPEICQHKSCATNIAYLEFKLGNIDDAVIALNSSPKANREYSREEAIERLSRLDDYFNEPD